MTSEAARSELYARKDVKALLAWVLSGHEDIRPSWDNASHAYHYPDVEELLGVEDAEPTLEELASHGLFERYLVSVQVACPTCRSTRNIINQYTCPHCDSLNLWKGALVEHYACGHVDFVEKFSKPDGRLICPKCAKELRLIGTDYRRIEGVYRCLNCRRDFSAPKPVHYCMADEMRFTYEEAVLQEIYGYKFNEKLRNEVVANVALGIPIVNFLNEQGYDVEFGALLEGASGIQHRFDLVAHKDRAWLAFDIVSSKDEVDQESVVSFFAKIFDVRPQKSVLIAMPALSEKAKRLATLYGVRFVEGSDVEAIVEGLRGLLASRKGATTAESRDISRRTVQTSTLTAQPKAEAAEEPTQTLQAPRPPAGYEDATQALRERSAKLRRLLESTAEHS